MCLLVAICGFWLFLTKNSSMICLQKDQYFHILMNFNVQSSDLVQSLKMKKLVRCFTGMVVLPLVSMESMVSHFQRQDLNSLDS